MRHLFLFLLFLGLSPVYPLCVLYPQAHLRKSASEEADVLLEAIPYMPLKKVAKKAGWYAVKDVDGKNYYVREDSVTEKFSCAVIKSEFANLRTGPGTQFPKIGAGMGEKYLSFRLLDEKKEWVKVEDSEGDESWILKRYVWID